MADSLRWVSAVLVSHTGALTQPHRMERIMYRQAITNNDGELLGFDYTYDDGPDDYYPEDAYGDGTYAADEEDAYYVSFPECVDNGTHGDDADQNHDGSWTCQRCDSDCTAEHVASERVWRDSWHYMSRQDIQSVATWFGILLASHDFGGTNDAPTIDGMPAGQWLDAMTMD